MKNTSKQSLRSVLTRTLLGMMLAAVLLFGEAGAAFVPVVEAKTASSYYSVATDKSADKVESFAKKVRADILAQDWNSLSKKLSYPVLVGTKKYKNAKAFVEYAGSGTISKDFLKAVKQETCEKMFCNYEGIAFNGGELWIADIGDGKQTSLKVVSMGEIIDSSKPAADKTDKSGKKKAEETAKAALAKPAGIQWKASKKRAGVKGVSATWKKVKGAEGYESRFYFSWPKNKKKYTKKTILSNNVSIYFYNLQNIRLKVRAFKWVNGKKVYSSWASSLIKSKDVSKLNK